jgi:F420-dependent oxidoreductase-like protein
MKLGLSLPGFTTAPSMETADLLVEAERLGLDSVWSSESYGTDALTPLAWWGSQTTRLRLGTAVVQMAARTPTATAMAAMTLDQLSNGRFVLGLGASGPQVVEGWYGQDYSQPLAQTREYVAIVRDVIAREAPVRFSGRHFNLPFQGGTGLGRSLRSTLHPFRPHLPIWLGAQGPKNVALAAEIADGWLPFLYSPRQDDHYRAALAEGFARRGGRPADFEVACLVQVAMGDDLEACAGSVKPMLALYIGGMGARGQNFHFNSVARLGYEGLARQVQDLYLAGRKQEAEELIPTSLVEELALVGPPERIKAQLARWERSLATLLIVRGADEKALRVLAELTQH